MSGPAPADAPPAKAHRRAGWHTATVTDSRPETPTARRIAFEVPTWPGNDAGSHLDVRLTAPDGYQATRSYSIASSGEGTRVLLAVDELPDGEVSPFLVHDLREGDQVEMHGPLGAYFVWTPPPAGEPSRPVQLIAGGSGVVPLFAMARAHAEADDATEFRLLYSARTPQDVFFRAELEQLTAAAPALWLDFVYTRQVPEGWPTGPGRITREVLDAATLPAASDPLVFVCGPTPFVETVAGWLVESGHRPGSVRTERFGGS
ncbi:MULTISPECIES: FAD-binding oxidoreductase [unclassified Microbacterium]|uniref:FAD-binding oxidoreductase n=1 Tax=unclassified Microbacterium TaxID=2609290 RepID=UPI00214C7A74|nr:MULTISPECIES: FAD-binding oxidoreductase [unclassified Microbacterium]MCR2809607.1 FAD-binding oxidoreductase [Microbacterium sp. zg.B185]WIM18068.1 FAD-binding oxidoreductase [Microbacterium sp. zg-B185]